MPGRPWCGRESCAAGLGADPLRMTDQLVLCTADALIGKSSDAIPRIASLTATEDASTAALALLLEGVIGKGLDFQYFPGVRSPNWLKIKRPGAVPSERFRNSNI